jgi:hypothetical protein
MKDFMDYFAIDWARTGDNIRTLLDIKMDQLGYNGGNSANFMKATSVALHKSERTIFTWLDGTKHPSIEDLVLLTKFFNNSLEDIIEIKGHVENKPIRPLFEKYSDAQQGHNDEALQIEFDFASAVLCNEMENQEYPIKTLADIILYLPLFTKEIFNDCLYRIQGDTYGDERKCYILKKLSYCYNNIENLDARQFADNLREYLSKKPVAYDITGKTRDKAKYEKYDEWMKITMEIMDSYSQFIKGVDKKSDFLKQELAYRATLLEYTSRAPHYTDREEIWS